MHNSSWETEKKMVLLSYAYGRRISKVVFNIHGKFSWKVSAFHEKMQKLEISCQLEHFSGNHGTFHESRKLSMNHFMNTENFCMRNFTRNLKLFMKKWNFLNFHANFMKRWTVGSTKFRWNFKNFSWNFSWKILRLQP